MTILPYLKERGRKTARSSLKIIVTELLCAYVMQKVLVMLIFSNFFLSLCSAYKKGEETMENCSCWVVHVPNLHSFAFKCNKRQLQWWWKNFFLAYCVIFNSHFLSIGQATLLSKEPTVQIQCMSGSMLVTIKNAPANYDGLFNGKIYPKGLSKNSTCLSEYL